MSDNSDLKPGHGAFDLPGLSPDIRSALTESARSNGRTVDEEAEYIIKSHLAASGEDND